MERPVSAFRCRGLLAHLSHGVRLVVEWSQKSLHHVLGKKNPSDLAGPQFEWRRGEDLLRQPDRAPVVVQVAASATVERIAGHPDAWSTLLPVAGASEVVP